MLTVDQAVGVDEIPRDELLQSFVKNVANSKSGDFS